MTTAVTISPTPILQFFDGQGRPCVGGTVLTQVGGVNAVTYQDSGGTVPLPNPIPLNNRGEVSNSVGTSCQLFLPSGVFYTFILTDANGNVLNQATFVGSANAITPAVLAGTTSTTGAALVGYSEATVYPAGTVGAQLNVLTSAQINVKDPAYGAKGDGTTDDTAAFTAALTAAAGGAAYVPAGNYKITSALSIPTGTHFFGVGLASIITQFTSNVQILIVAGDGTKTCVHDFMLQYNTRQPVANTLALAMDLRNFNESSIYNILTANAYIGIYSGPTSNNTTYSSTLRDIRNQAFTGYGLYINGNNSGNVYTNIYNVGFNNADPTLGGVLIQGEAGGILTQVNVEQIAPSQPPFQFSACDAMVCNSLHIETVGYTVDFSGLITLAGSRVNIRGLSIENTTYTTTNVASIISLGGSAQVTGGQVVLEDVMDRGNTVTSANKSTFFSSNAASTARIIGYTLNAFTPGLSGGLGVLLQNNNTFSTTIGLSIFLAYSASIASDASTGDIFTVIATNGTAFTLNNPTNPTTGQRVKYRIKNTSGGALGTLTFGTAFKLAAWTQPANANSRTIEFDYDGTNWIEASRTTTDVPN